MMLYTMVELIHTLSYIRTRKLYCCLYLLRILLNMLMRLKKPPTDITKNNGIQLKGGAFLATTSATAELCDNPDAPCYTMFCQLFMSGALPAVTNLLQEFADDGMKSRTTPILEGGDDEDIAKIESRTTPIREGEDDEHAGHTDAMVFSKLQFVPNSATTSPSDSADTSSLFRS